MSAEAVPDAELIERLTFVADILADQGRENWAADIRLAASRLAELQAERTRLRAIVEQTPISAMVGKCGWKTWEQARDGMAAALSASPIAPTDTGRSPSGPGSRPTGGAAGASPAKPSIPNAENEQ